MSKKGNSKETHSAEKLVGCSLILVLTWGLAEGNLKHRVTSSRVRVWVLSRRKKKVNFPNYVGWTPNKQFCFSKSAPFQILSPHSKLWYHIYSQVVKQRSA